MILPQNNVCNGPDRGDDKPFAGIGHNEKGSTWLRQGCDTMATATMPHTKKVSRNIKMAKFIGQLHATHLIYIYRK